MEIGEMSVKNSEECRISLAERENDRALGMDDTTEQIVSDKVAELMDENSTDEDSIVVLMESDAFVRALRNVLSTHGAKCWDSFGAGRRLILVDQLVREAENQLSHYVEVNL